MLLQVAIRVFENFITRIQTISKRKQEIEMTRKSTFYVAVALEEFALNYGKYHLTDSNSSVKIDSHNLGKSGQWFIQICNYAFAC